jgi:hypothetical protein
VDIRDNWSLGTLLYTPVFGELMPRDRYEEIGRHLHFVDNSISPDPEDKFWKIRKLFHLFNDSFQEEFNIGRDVSVDESLIFGAVIILCVDTFHQKQISGA